LRGKGTGSSTSSAPRNTRRIISSIISMIWSSSMKDISMSSWVPDIISSCLKSWGDCGRAKNLPGWVRLGTR